MGYWTGATPAMMCSPTALIGRPRSRPNEGQRLQEPDLSTWSAQPPAVFGARASEPRQEPDTRSHRACVRGAAERACGRIVRTIGVVRARAKIGLQNLAYNIRRLVTLERLAAT